ncbi:MAG TPA: Rrf2 family transcriptional regulator [Clostridiales bacterium]|nr:Rrf2 family transcriptional regulator [Clostridiales bacterium]
MISTKGRYGLRVMIDLAQHGGAGYVPLRDVAQRQEISKKYLEIIVKEMVAGKLVVGASGKGGGYKLLRSPEEYKIGEILELMEGSMNSVACLADTGFECPRKKSCETLPMWTEFDELVHNFFYSKTLKDLIHDT